MTTPISEGYVKQLEADNEELRKQLLESEKAQDDIIIFVVAASINATKRFMQHNQKMTMTQDDVEKRIIAKIKAYKKRNINAGITGDIDTVRKLFYSDKT